MTIRTTLFTALLAASLALPAYAAVFVNADINLGPPEPRYEYIPAPRPGFVWSPGFWEWDGYQRHWVEGYWVEQRPGFVWVPDRWDHFDNGWRFSRGHYYAGRPSTRTVIVNRNVYYDNDRHDRHDDHHDNGNHNGWDKDHDRHGPGVGPVHEGRSNGHGPHERD